uniref:Uncharacterized protein n=1 Tax=Ascaris lumbricoides TaxID=6252 RepID=A0A0M3IPX3_ASCLU
MKANTNADKERSTAGRLHIPAAVQCSFTARARRARLAKQGRERGREKTFALEVRRRHSLDISQLQPNKENAKRTRGEKCGSWLTDKHLQNEADEQPRAEVDDSRKGRED